MSALDRIKEANQCDLARFVPFVIAGRHLGFVRRDALDTLLRWPEVFRTVDHGVALHPNLDRAADPVCARTEAVEAVLKDLAAAGAIRGWRNERYPINRWFHEPAVMAMERAAVPRFGLPGYGVHLNGLVRRRDGLHMWVGQRALDKTTAPGRWDQLAAGGQPVDLSLAANMAKEAEEEAGLPSTLARAIRPVGAITYCLEAEGGLRPDVVYCFDLELPEDFEPVNRDGEVHHFELWPMERVREAVCETDLFKFNCALVVIDCLIRHGVIGPDDPDYLALQLGLRAREQRPGTPWYRDAGRPVRPG